MGTRHLICVVKDGEYKVGQYGQWDGYPSGQGASKEVDQSHHDIKYFPVKHWYTFSITPPPTLTEFLTVLKEDDEDQE